MEEAVKNEAPIIEVNGTQQKLQELSQAYAQQCAQLGEVTYRILQLQEDEKKMVLKLKELNQEAEHIKKSDLPKVGVN